VEQTQQIFIYYNISIPMRSQRTKDEWNFSVLLLFLGTLAFCLNCLSVRSLHSHSEQRQNLQNFSLLICQTNTTHCTATASGFHHNC
jgi:hypothetical protein